MSAISITPANVLQSSGARLQTAVTSVTVTAGQAVFYNAALGKWSLGAAGTSGAQAVSGIAIQSAAAGQNLTVALTDPAFALGASVASGSTIWLHTTAGDLTLTQGDLTTGDSVIAVGVAQGTTGGSTNLIFLNPTPAAPATAGVL
jgi:hypothetical protein